MNNMLLAIIIIIVRCWCDYGTELIQIVLCIQTW